MNTDDLENCDSSTDEKPKAPPARSLPLKLDTRNLPARMKIQGASNIVDITEQMSGKSIILRAVASQRESRGYIHKGRRQRVGFNKGDFDPALHRPDSRGRFVCLHLKCYGQFPVGREIARTGEFAAAPDLELNKSL